MKHTEALKLAKECGATAYTNRHYPDAAAVTFSPRAWEKFCKQALAAPVQEPFYQIRYYENSTAWHDANLSEYSERPEKDRRILYTIPPAQPAPPVQEPDGLRHIGEQDCLLDVDEKAWSSLVENRGGCRCHISPKCSACSEPISEEEMNEVGYTYTTTPAAQPVTVQVAHGCHSDLDSGQEPDTCVLDSGNHDDCVYAKEYGQSAREKCGEWKLISFVAPPAQPAPVYRRRADATPELVHREQLPRQAPAAPVQEPWSDERAYHEGRADYEASVGYFVKGRHPLFHELTEIQRAGWVAKAAKRLYTTPPAAPVQPAFFCPGCEKNQPSGSFSAEPSIPGFCIGCDSVMTPPAQPAPTVQKPVVMTERRINDLIVEYATKIESVAELCTFVDYDPEIGRTPEHWKASILVLGAVKYVLANTPPAAQPTPVQEPDMWRVKLPRWTAPGIWNPMPETQQQKADLADWKSQDGAVIEYAVVITAPFAAQTATCGAVWTFMDGGPVENGMHFCPKCGSKVTEGGAHESV